MANGTLLSEPPAEVSAPTPLPAVLSTFRALRHRNYRLFFVGQAVSLVGTWVQITALMWLAYQLTGTSRWPSLVAAAQLLPAFLFGAWGGVLADRRPRRRLLCQTQGALMALALTLAVLTWAGVATVWHLLLVATLTGLVNAVDLPVRLAFLVDMVGKDDVVNAVALNSLTFNVARTAGPALGGVLLLLQGPALCFLLNGLSFLAVLTALARMGLEGPAAAPRERRGGWESLVAGFRYVTRHGRLRMLLPLTGVMSLFGWPILALLPALAQRRLEVDGGGYSSMLTAIGVGALCSAALVATFGSIRRRRFFLGAGVVVAATGMIGLSVAPVLPMALGCCALVGVGLVMFFATSQAVFQLSAGDHNRGRVMGIYSIILAGANPLGNLLAGPAADEWGEGLVLCLLGGGILTCALVLLILFSPGERPAPS
jgi:MFS family permease